MEGNNSNRVLKSALTCLFCEQNFSSEEEIMLHMPCHNVEKPFHCIECDQRYAYKTALRGV